MLDVLLKKAKGYEAIETVQEFAFDEEGNKRLLKEKVSTKSVPPDISAIKTYMELTDSEIYSMSNNELVAEKERLIKTLKTRKNKEQNGN